MPGGARRMRTRCGDKQASYGPPEHAGTYAPSFTSYCKGCKPTDYVDVKSRKCEGDGCAKQPTFGYPGTKPAARWCSKCAPAGAANTVTKRCEGNRQGAPCTSIHPSFDLSGTQRKKARYCALCKVDGMVDVKTPNHCECGAVTYPCFWLGGRSREEVVLKVPQQAPRGHQQATQKSKGEGA